MNSKAGADYKISLIMIGDSSVGKTCTLLKFTDENFNTSHISTIGIDFKIKTIQIDGKNVKLQIWDTAGQERYRTITQTYFRDIQGVIVVYDCTSEDSFNNVRNWVRQVEAHTNGRENVEAILLGNKSDLKDQQVIESEEGRALANDFGMTFFETSAKTGQNIQDAFFHLTKSIKDKMAAKEEARQRDGTAVSDMRQSVMITGREHVKEKKKKNGGCCK